MGERGRKGTIMMHHGHPQGDRERGGEGREVGRELEVVGEGVGEGVGEEGGRVQ